jgi:hypothetical protein
MKYAFPFHNSSFILHTFAESYLVLQLIKKNHILDAEPLT